MNRNKLSLILIFGLISLGILKFFPITGKEELVTQTFTIDGHGEARTTLNVREQAIVTGTYSRSPTKGATYFYIKITAPDGETIIWEESGSSSGSFRFIADVGGSYRVIIFNGYYDAINVQFTAEQSYQKTVI